MLVSNYPSFRTAVAAVCGLAFCSASAHAVLLADLRQDYDTPSVPHTNNQTAAGKVPDSIDTGSWTYFARSTIDPGLASVSTALTYSTSAFNVRNANAYQYPNGTFTLPALSNTQLIADTPNTAEGAPAANELAVHPGDVSISQPYLVLRWTPGVGSFGQVDLSGAFRDLGSVGDGVGVTIYNTNGTVLRARESTVLNAATAFNLTTTVSAGQSIEFVVDPNGGFAGDQSALRVAINSVPEPALLSLAAVAGVGVLRRRRA